MKIASLIVVLMAASIATAQQTIEKFIVDYQPAFEKLRDAYLQMEIKASCAASQQTYHAYPLNDGNYQIDYQSPLRDPRDQQKIVGMEKMSFIYDAQARLVSRMNAAPRNIGRFLPIAGPYAYSVPLPAAFSNHVRNGCMICLADDGDTLTITFTKAEEPADSTGRIATPGYKQVYTLLPKQGYALKSWEQILDGVPEDQSWLVTMEYQGAVDGVPLLHKVETWRPGISQRGEEPDSCTITIDEIKPAGEPVARVGETSP